MTKINFSVKTGLTTGLITMDAVTGVVTASKFIGDGSQLSGISNSVNVSNDTTTDANRYLIFEDIISGEFNAVNVSASKLTFNPSTGTLSSTIFSGSGQSLTALNATQLTAGTIPGDRGVTAGSNSSSFIEYNGITKTAGHFDGGTSSPTNTTRLNYDGNFHATNFYGNGENLTALNGTQLTTGTIPGDRGVTAGSNSSSFIEYNGITKTAGQFDGGTSSPTNTTRLNYDGNFHATNFYGTNFYGTNFYGSGLGITDVSHSGLSNTQGGDTDNKYHLTLEQYNTVGNINQLSKTLNNFIIADGTNWISKPLDDIKILLNNTNTKMYYISQI